MTRPGSIFGWDAFWPFGGLASTGAFAAHLTAFITLRQLVLGRRLAVRLDDGDLVLTLVEAESRVGMKGLAAGQLNGVRLVAHQVRWNEHRFGRASALLHDVRVTRTSPPQLVAGPVELDLDVPAEALDELFRWAAPRLTGTVDADGVARLRLANRPAAGQLEVHASVVGPTLRLKPLALIRGRRWALPRWIPARTIALPPLPNGMTLTAVEFDAHLLRLHATVPEWRMDMPRARLDDMIAQVSTVGMPLRLSWPSRRRD